MISLSLTYLYHRDVLQRLHENRGQCTEEEDLYIYIYLVIEPTHERKILVQRKTEPRYISQGSCARNKPIVSGGLYQQNSAPCVYKSRLLFFNLKSYFRQLGVFGDYTVNPLRKFTKLSIYVYSRSQVVDVSVQVTCTLLCTNAIITKQK